MLREGGRLVTKKENTREKRKKKNQTGGREFWRGERASGRVWEGTRVSRLVTGRRVAER